MTNALRNIIAVLQEYNFTKKDANNSQFFCKLYKSKEGNWYDVEGVKFTENNPILRALKLAIENQNITIKT